MGLVCEAEYIFCRVTDKEPGLYAMGRMNFGDFAIAADPSYDDKVCGRFDKIPVQPGEYLGLLHIAESNGKIDTLGIYSSYEVYKKPRTGWKRLGEICVDSAMAGIFAAKEDLTKAELTVLRYDTLLESGCAWTLYGFDPIIHGFCCMAKSDEKYVVIAHRSDNGDDFDAVEIRFNEPADQIWFSGGNTL